MLDRLCEGLQLHFEKLSKDWKGSVLDAFALPFIGNYVYRRDFRSAMRMGIAFGTAKALSEMTSPYFKNSETGRLTDSFLKGFTLRAILDCDLKRACFGGSFYLFAETVLIGTEKVLLKELLPVFKIGTNIFAFTSAANLSLEEGEESAFRFFVAKAVSSGTKYAASSWSNCEVLLEAIESVANSTLQNFIKTRNFQEGAKEAFLTTLSFTAKKVYSVIKDLFNLNSFCVAA